MLRSRRFRALALAAACGLLATAGTAQMQPIAGGNVMAAVERLQPGQFLWVPEIAPSGPMLVVVNIATQRVVAYRNGVPIAVSTVSTGKPGHRTPTGVFTILQKAKWHRSSKYSNAPMPFMQRLTWYGIALHAGNLPGYPASHGCIRLPSEFARLLFDETELGMTVIVTNQAPALRIGAKPTQSPAFPAGPAVWRPELSRAGPVSIVVSGADRRMVVLRNGVEIGSAPVAFDGEIDRVQAYVLQDVVAGNYRWQRLALPGEGYAAANRAGPDAGRFQGSDPFRRALADVVGPGTTLVVIPDSLGLGADLAPPAQDPDALIENDPGVGGWLEESSVVAR
ncbi:L,D-transpeptidase [Sphingomonas sp. HITSZ_GF]|uniref:L,D-transpeptidase n=1 Tax=Sphingomonas sp. HITSZ_GF TaxID=3037247 RepID=UPI00240DE21E|nr:L,D-transpeptidase [Sphingomonas sp. HITSZ_GF]MDG2533272.1 L,D-transpeptidase [Sphingomonas sp. HITSZ_GF]